MQKKLPREKCLTVTTNDEIRFDLDILQEGMGKCPWRIAICCILLNRTRRAQAELAVERILLRWPKPELLALASFVELLEIVQRCGFAVKRTQTLKAMSFMYSYGNWKDMSELPGIGNYAADAIALFCFGNKNLKTTDKALVRAIGATI